MKLGNLFLTDKMELKVGDFGLATKLEFEGDRKKTVCGTPNYIAPEILEGKHGHSYEVDIWSLGVIIYTLVIGKPPYETSDVKTTYHRIKTNTYSFPEHILISGPAKDLITRILNLDPTKRPTLDEILAHPFFHTGHAIPKLMPASTLACPPSNGFLAQYQTIGHVDSLNAASSNEKAQLGSTAPAGLSAALKSKLVKDAFLEPPGSKMGGREEAKSPGKLVVGSTGERPIGRMDPPKSARGDLCKKVDALVWVKKWEDVSAKYGLGMNFSRKVSKNTQKIRICDVE